MSNQPLARKYRPRTFQDLIGQRSTVLALLGTITQKRLPTGVIFSGTRGVGKTSLARIYAKALCCEKGPTIEPCGDCLSCDAVATGSHEDVVEIDGASNNGVDEVRALKETTSYIPQRSKYRIYIIDEVHMLSLSAFNALLKILEEPPSHVIFLFATTELHKIPQTVMSRCQIFHLQKISASLIAKHMEVLLKQENISWEEGVLRLIAKEGQGSLRDALTFLDQVIVTGGQEIKRETLTAMLGELSQKYYLNFIEGLINKDASNCLKFIESFDQKGTSYIPFVERLASLVRHGFVMGAMGQKHRGEDLWELEEEDLLRLEALAKNSATLDLNRIFRLLVSVLEDLNDSFMDRYTFENICLEWCLAKEVLKKKEQTLEAPTHKEELKVEKKSLTAQFKEELGKSEEPVVIKEEKTLEKSAVAKKKAAPVFDRSFPETWKDLLERWKQIKPLQARKLEELVALEYSKDKITLLVREGSLVGPTLLQSETQKKMTRVLASLFNFHGIFFVREESQQEKEDYSKVNTVKSVPESVLDEKNRLYEEEKKKRFESLQNHPLAQKLCETFEGKIVETHIE